MAKSKLLRLMVMSWVALITNTSMAHKVDDALGYGLLPTMQEVMPTSEQLNWAKNMRNQGQNLTKNAIIQKLNELDSYKQGDGLAADTANTVVLADNRTELKIFVSSSMQKNLLKAYHKQAVKYGGTLVFKGLPDGSFKELSRLVLSISENGEAGSIQIDDEAFDRFAVNSVPAILLIKEEGYLDGEEQSCKVTYDKITGSIGVKVALEKFAQSGDLAVLARGLLEND